MKPTVILKQTVAGANEKALERFADQACRAVGLGGAVTILITSSRDLKVLNKRFKNNGRPTDVLSFPAPSFTPDFAGDIAISLDIAARNARTLKHSVTDELQVLILHGILHLAGYDHESDNGQMARKEQTLRKTLVLPAALTERASLRRPTARRRARSRL